MNPLFNPILTQPPLKRGKNRAMDAALMYALIDKTLWNTPASIIGEWNRDKALVAVGATLLDPNEALDFIRDAGRQNTAAGFTNAWTNPQKIGISPWAKYPDLTLLHEIGHAWDLLSNGPRYSEVKGEIIAEAIAILVSNKLGIAADDPVFKGDYIRYWLGEDPSVDPVPLLELAERGAEFIMKAGRA